MPFGFKWDVMRMGWPVKRWWLPRVWYRNYPVFRSRRWQGVQRPYEPPARQHYLTVQLWYWQFGASWYT